MTARGKLQRMVAGEISVIGRNTQGVRIMSLDEGDTLAAIVRVPRDEDGSGNGAAARAAGSVPREQPIRGQQWPGKSRGLTRARRRAIADRLDRQATDDAVTGSKSQPRAKGRGSRPALKGRLKHMSRRALITGITGQDGAYLAEFLLEQGLRSSRHGAPREHRGLRAHGAFALAAAFAPGRSARSAFDRHALKRGAPARSL